MMILTHIIEAIKIEVHKLIECDFIREEQHPDQVANIVPVFKKNEKIRICIDFRDLNTACLKDKFSLSITDVMTDNTCGFIREEQHPNWVTNIIPLLKKNEKSRVCIDFRDLNTACPKDEFSLPITDIMICLLYTSPSPRDS